MHQNLAVVFWLHLKSMIQLFDVLLIQEPLHFLHQSPRPLPWNDINERDFIFHCLINHPIELVFNFVAFIVDVMEIETDFGHRKN